MKQLVTHTCLGYATSRAHLVQVYTAKLPKLMLSHTSCVQFKLPLDFVGSSFHIRQPIKSCRRLVRTKKVHRCIWQRIELTTLSAYMYMCTCWKAARFGSEGTLSTPRVKSIAIDLLVVSSWAPTSSLATPPMDASREGSGSWPTAERSCSMTWPLVEWMNTRTWQWGYRLQGGRGYQQWVIYVHTCVYALILVHVHVCTHVHP